MRDSHCAARCKREAGGADAIADGVRKFRMGSVPDRGGRELKLFFAVR